MNTRGLQDLTLIIDQSARNELAAIYQLALEAGEPSLEFQGERLPTALVKGILEVVDSELAKASNQPDVEQRTPYGRH